MCFLLFFQITPLSLFLALAFVVFPLLKGIQSLPLRILSRNPVSLLLLLSFFLIVINRLSAAPLPVVPARFQQESSAFVFALVLAFVLTFCCGGVV